MLGPASPIDLGWYTLFWFEIVVLFVSTRRIRRDFLFMLSRQLVERYVAHRRAPRGLKRISTYVLRTEQACRHLRLSRERRTPEQASCTETVGMSR